MIHHRKRIIGLFASILVVALLAAFYLSKPDKLPSHERISVSQLVSSPTGTTFSQQRDYSHEDFPRQELRQLVLKFVGNLERHRESKLACSYSRALNLELDTIESNGTTIRVQSKVVLPVELTANVRDDGAAVLQHADGFVLATDRTHNYSIIADAALESLYEAWNQCTSQHASVLDDTTLSRWKH